MLSRTAVRLASGWPHVRDKVIARVTWVAVQDPPDLSVTEELLLCCLLGKCCRWWRAAGHCRTCCSLNLPDAFTFWYVFGKVTLKVLRQVDEYAGERLFTLSSWFALTDIDASVLCCRRHTQWQAESGDTRHHHWVAELALTRRPIEISQRLAARQLSEGALDSSTPTTIKLQPKLKALHSGRRFV